MRHLDYIKKIAGGTIIVTAVVYGLFQARELFTGVSLSLSGIRDGMTYTEEILNIAGTAPRATTLSINGREIFINKTGAFAEKILLPDGYNIITIAAVDKFGNQKEKVYRVYHESTESLAQRSINNTNN